MNIDFWILAFSFITVVVTIWMGFWSAKRSKTASDFFVAGRSVSVGWNASAISGEYLSAASFMGVAGMVMSSGYDALWYPVCYACGYLFLLLFIAGPLRRFGAYTIPDFAEGRYDSPLFRKIAVIFVLFIGFFYTMPQMKGAGTALAYIFPGLHYSAGVVLVGAVITLNVALGGMKGITLVQAFQYWLKMFAISVPIFVLMSIYGQYGDHVGTRPPTDKPNAKAPAQSEWVSPFGLLTTKAIKASHAQDAKQTANTLFPLRPDLTPESHITVPPVTNVAQALGIYSDLTGRQLIPRTNRFPERLDELLKGKLSEWRLVQPAGVYDSGVRVHADGALTAGDVKQKIETAFRDSGILLEPSGAEAFRASVDETKATAASGVPPQVSSLQQRERRYALLYTYSLIIALVCGTAGLPHILVRFYTNPDGVAAKRTTMWVMILIGVFYLFPPIFGAMGRNLLPELYAATGAKGTDKVVLELPRILNERYAPLGSILSGITCAGAFAAFMSTFSGLLVSMTGALAHDVYGRMLRPQSTPEERLRAFRWAAVIIGVIAILLGTQVEQLQINFMVGQAFAIAAASYFPLLFMSTWWRGMTMKGAATGMLGGGLAALGCTTLTNLSDLKKIDLAAFWAENPLLRILCEQPAIWTVPLAIVLMVVVSKLTQREVPADIRMKMLVLHAPETLGLKQEYIQEHQHGH
ncbi:MAG: cation acetate symporter [Verrucomicrobiota bacterium]